MNHTPAANSPISSLLIAPDFSPEHLGGWHIFNTALQRHTGSAIRLFTSSSAAEMRETLAANPPSIIYANPFDAAALVRQNNYLPLARPAQKSDEILIAAHTNSDARKHTDLKAGMRIALTDNQDIKLIGLRLLEAADLREDDLHWLPAPSYQAAARLLIQGQADDAFFLADSYHALSDISKKHMRVLLESHICDISHVILLHPSHQERRLQLRAFLCGIKNEENGQAILHGLGLPAGFEKLDQEEVEFMIDLMQTLLD